MKSFKLSDLFELLGSLIFVGAIMGGLTYWAQTKAQPPVNYAKESLIDLLPIDAAIEGEIQLYPTTIEDQKEDFTYKHGREILKEQQSRKAGSWTSIESSLSWTFAIDSPQKYQLLLTYSSVSEGGKIQASLNNQTLLGIIDNTGGENSWKELNFGDMELPAGTHTLTLKGTELIGEELLRLERVSLSPEKE
jgi:hypothetical protein